MIWVWKVTHGISMRIYAARVASRGINVNCIVPGVTKTDAWTRLSQKRGLGDDPTEMMKGVIERGMPLKKVVDPMDVGNLVVMVEKEEELLV